MEERLIREGRLHWLDAQLQANHFPTPEAMIQELGIKRSQAFQDVRYLRSVKGAPIAWNRARRGWYYTEPFAPLPLLHLTHEEADALRRSFLIAEAYLGADEAQTLARLTQRLAQYVQTVAPQAGESAGGAVQSFVDAPTNAWLAQCKAAIDDRQLLRFVYHSPRQDAPTERLVRPYHVHNERGEWCLISYCEERQAKRYFLLGRMEQVRTASGVGAFVIPRDFDPKEEIGRGLDLMTGGDLVTVVLVFDAYQSRHLRERELHPTETRTELEGARLQVTMQVAWGDGEALCRRVLSYGSHVEVCEPTVLRQRVAGEIAALAKIYQNNFLPGS